MAWPWDRLIMKAKIKKFAESSGDMIGSLVTNATTDHIGRGALDKRADLLDTKQVVGDIKEDAGAPSAISTGSSTAALTANPAAVGGFDPKKKGQEEKRQEAYLSMFDNVQVPGEVAANNTNGKILTNSGQEVSTSHPTVNTYVGQGVEPTELDDTDKDPKKDFKEGENYGDLGSTSDGGRLGAMHSLTQQATSIYNANSAQNLQAYDTTNLDLDPSKTYANANNALVDVSKDSGSPLLSGINDVGGKTNLSSANRQTLINKDKFQAANSDAIHASDTQEHEKELQVAGSYSHENEEKKLESLILSKFPNHDSRHLAVFESYYDHKHGKKKIQSKKYNSSFVLKHSDYQNYFLEYLEYFSTEGSRIILERYEDQNKVDKYQFINSNSGESLPRTLKEENMEEFDLGKLDTEDEVESGEGGELLDILKKVADRALSPDDAIEEVKAAMDKEDEEELEELEEPAEDSPEDEEELEEPAEDSPEECATTHAQAVTESKAKAAKPSAKKPEVKKTAPKAVAKKPVPKAAPKKGLKESSKPFASNFYYIYSNGRVVDFGQATRITESQITLANGKSYNLASVTLAPMRGW